MGATAAAATGIDIARIEEAGLNALQMSRQLFYDGWLLRLSPGKAKRGRSVTAHFGSTLPLDDKIARCAAVYAQHGLPLLFRITPFAHPGTLDAELGARGYAAYEETRVMAARLPAAESAAMHAVTAPAGITAAEVDAGAFADIVGALRGSSPQQRDAHRDRLAQSPLAARFLVLRDGDRPVCAAQVTLEAELAGVYDVATAEDARGRGCATWACATLLAWSAARGARTAYLQVGADNAPAISIYRRLGFGTVYTYHYRARPEAFR